MTHCFCNYQADQEPYPLTLQFLMVYHLYYKRGQNFDLGPHLQISIKCLGTLDITACLEGRDVL